MKKMAIFVHKVEVEVVIGRLGGRGVSSQVASFFIVCATITIDTRSLYDNFRHATRYINVPLMALSFRLLFIRTIELQHVNY